MLPPHTHAGETQALSQRTQQHTHTHTQNETRALGKSSPKIMQVLPNDRTLTKLAKQVRMWRKRNLSKLMPTAKRLTVLSIDDGPITDQLRAVLADKKRSAQFMEQLEMWMSAKDRNVSRKEFRRAYVAMGIAAPQYDVDVLFGTIDQKGSGEVGLDELKSAVTRIQCGELPEATEKSIAAAKRLAAKLAKAQTTATRPTRLLAPTPARVLPPKRTCSNLTPAALEFASPTMLRAASVLSPAVKRSIASISPAVAKATGVPDLTGEMFSPVSAARLAQWAQRASRELELSGTAAAGARW